MAAGILKEDRGIVGFGEMYGGTWHRLAQYVVIDGPVPIPDAVDLLNYEVRKQQMYLQDGTLVKDAFCLQRMDSGTVVYPSVGPGYEVMSGLTVMANLLASVLGTGEVEIESIGTLWNGRVQFINMNLDRIVVPGDESDVFSKLLVGNAFGGNALIGCAHDIRVVCNNTYRWAMSKGKANGTFARFLHTANAATRMADHAQALADVRREKAHHQELLAWLANQTMTGADVDAFLSAFVPLPLDQTEWTSDTGVTATVMVDGVAIPEAAKADVSARTIKTVREKRDAIQELFEQADYLVGDARRSRYGMLNAVTDWTDHGAQNAKHDAGFIFYDGLHGQRDKAKQSAFELLTADVPAAAQTV